jgi:hypothetical protein
MMFMTKLDDDKVPKAQQGIIVYVAGYNVTGYNHGYNVTQSHTGGLYLQQYFAQAREAK